jgi:hypothetical protein
VKQNKWSAGAFGESYIDQAQEKFHRSVQYEFSKIRALHGYLKEIGYGDSPFNFANYDQAREAKLKWLSLYPISFK